MMLGASAARAEVVLTTVALPSSPDFSRAHLDSIGALTASRLSVPFRPNLAPQLPLADRLKRARSLSVAGKIDEAAQLLDEVLAEGTRAPERIPEPSSFVAGALRRAAIAMGRGEAQVGQEILERLYRWDPTLTLAPVDATPPLTAALEEIRTRFGKSPPLVRTDLGALDTAAITLVARRTADGLEVSRFDDGQLTTRVIARATDREVALELARVPAQKALTKRGSQLARKEMIAGPVLAAIGAELAGTGIYFAVHAASRIDAINRGCTMTMPCNNTQNGAWGSDQHSSTAVASVLLPVGAALLVTGTVLAVVGARHRQSSMAVRSSGLAWSF